MDLQGKVAIVTGASSGIGVAVARAMVSRGVRVALVARTQAKLEALVEEFGSEWAASFALDVTDTARLIALPERVVGRFGRLDIVVNNAGVNHRGPVSGRSVLELREILDANLVAPVLLVRSALGHLSTGGAIVNVASLAGKVPVPDEAAYSATKAGLRAFSRALGSELRDRAIHVGAVCPGPVDTGFFADLSIVPDLVFSQPMSSAQQVAEAVLRVVDARAPEIDVPALSGKLATIGYLSPRLFGLLRPALEQLGARNKRRLMRQRAAF